MALVATFSILAPVSRADEITEVSRLHDAGQREAAMSRADAFLALHPTDPQMRFLKGWMLAVRQDNAAATRVFRALSEDYPDLAEPHNNLAALRAAAGDYAGARAELEQAIRANPTYVTAHENLGDVHAVLAAQSYARALVLEPGLRSATAKLALVRGLYQADAVGALSPSSTLQSPSTGPAALPPRP